MRRTLLCLALVAALLATGCIKQRPPADGLTLPEFEPLPAVQFVPGPDGTACTASPEDTANLARRERLRDIREETYRLLLESLGYQ